MVPNKHHMFLLLLQTPPIPCMQESGNMWTNELAGMCHLAGLKVLLSGRFQPPVRIGALRACHQWAHVAGVECVECG